MFVPPPELVVLETEHWILNQCVDAALPGYLIAGSRDPKATSLARLSPDAQAELGTVLARAQAALDAVLAPERTLVSRWGFETGHTVHFHVIPITREVIDAFLSDVRYRSLMEFYSRQPLDDPGEFDGSDIGLFVVREFLESPKPPVLSMPSIEETVRKLRGAISPS